MVRTNSIFSTTFILLSFVFNSFAQNVGINDTGVAPDKSALLDLNSTDKGFLITRADTSSISSPAFGLMTLAPKDSCMYLFNGNYWMGMGGAGNNCVCNFSNEGTTPPSGPYCGTDKKTKVVDVINPKTGKTWMDRNLGASQVATSSTDEASYGDLYQWGRCNDGHEKRTSKNSETLSSTDDPGHGDFILGTPDWRSPLNNNLWQGVNGINNPCPSGYRIPTSAEMEAERVSWISNDVAGAFASPLKFPAAGNRFGTVGSGGIVVNEGGGGNYWSSNVNGTWGIRLVIYVNHAAVSIDYRRNGNSVRCIKD